MLGRIESISRTNLEIRYLVQNLTEFVLDRHYLVIVHKISVRWDLDWDLGYTKVDFVPLLGEIVAVQDLTITAKDFDGGATVYINGHVVFLGFVGHNWAVSDDWLLDKLLSHYETGKGVVSAMLGNYLFNFDLVVVQVEFEVVELVLHIY